ncbi:MAG: bifunctional metallophosphatase/5'-nucleotidase, partial [Lawsonibacter sp.]|nr:bifunctional metallophosphatase/5'-nucleotidase [Lawsonibacter sp.]
MRRLPACLLAILLLLSLLPVSVWASAPTHRATVLFTHDLHSHFLPQPDGQGGESGGYARLKTALDRERAAHPDALVLDGGDFSIGSLIQTLYTTQGAELRTMGALGYDAAAVGNHEFDHTGTGFAAMLNAAVGSGDRVPALLMANYKPAGDNPNKLDIQRAMSAYGVRDYMLLERSGVTYGIFGLMGEDSHSCAPSSGFTLGNMAENAQRCVDALKAEGAEFIICLSHSGTNEKKKLSEDERLAEKVPGIDLIVSGHT